MADASDNIVIATLPKNARDVIRVQITTYRGHRLLDVRVYDRDGFPTKAGVCVQIEHSPDLVAALNAAEAEARRRGLIEGDAE